METMKSVMTFVPFFHFTLLIISHSVAAQQDEHHTIIVIVHPYGQDVTLPFGLRQAAMDRDERAAWLIGNLRVPYEINSLTNGILTGYSADLHNNNLIIKNIRMNDNRNGTEYQSVIGTPGTVPGTLDVVERGNVTILYVAGVPGKVPNVIVTNSTNGNVVNFTVTWREPVNHLDPIIMYNVSCSGDPPCPQSYNTSNNHTRTHTFISFTANSYYTFSVVAINSIGSGEAGVVTLNGTTNTTIAPSVVNITTTTTTTSSENVTTDISNNSMTSTLFVNTTSTAMSSIPPMTTAIMISSSIITTIVSSTTGMMTTTIATSSVHTSSDFPNTMPSSTESPSESISGTIVPTIVPTINTASKITNDKSTESIAPSMSKTPDSGESDGATSDDEDDQSSTTLVIIIIIIVVMIICCCCCMGILFCCCCEKRERQYPDEKLCIDPRCSFASLVILGVMTCGISILVWYMCLKNQSDDKGQDKYHKITNVSIIVLGVYTCGTSALLWWLYKGFCNTREKYNCNLEDKSAIPLSTSEVKSSKVPSVTNQLAGHNEEVGQFAIPSQTGTIQAPHNEEPVPKNEEPVPKNEEPVPNNDEAVTSVINEMYQDRVIPDGYAVVDTEDVIARRNAAAAAKQDPVQHQTTANGEKYALPNKPPSTKQQGVKYVELERLPTSGRIHTTANDVFTPYAELC